MARCFPRLAQRPSGHSSTEVFLEKLDGALPRKFGFFLIVAASGVIVEAVVRLRIHMHDVICASRFQVPLVFLPTRIDALIQLGKLNHEGPFDILPQLLCGGGPVESHSRIQRFRYGGRKQVYNVAAKTKDYGAELPIAPRVLVEKLSCGNEILLNLGPIQLRLHRPAIIVIPGIAS